MTDPKYKVRRVFFDKRQAITVAENLTEEAAQKIVQDDMETNPSPVNDMLVYNKIKSK